MSYVDSRPARSPDGAYYEVAASPRGDLLLYFSETGPQTWLSANVGVLGFLTFVVNRLVFRGRWQVVVRRAPASRSVGPGSGVLLRREVAGKAVEAELARLVAAIESGQLQPEAQPDGQPR